MIWNPGAALRVEANGASLEARCWGPSPSEAMTLVLLHEGLGCVALWRGFPERLAEVTGCGVLAWSRAGYGHSDPCALPRPLDYMEREADFSVGPMLDALGIHRAVLIGHSDGGSIAALYGAQRDPRVSALALIAPHFFVEDCSVAAIQAAHKGYDTGLRDKMAKYHADPDCAFRGWNDAWLDPKFRDWDITACLDRIDVPVLTIQGADDPYGTDAQVEILAERCTSARGVHVLPGCGHAPHQDQPGKVLALVQDFVKGLA